MQAGKRRKRGIKASKIKLAEALNACGLSTQIALAEKIANMEGTDLVPKDLVNRAFREQAIEFTSLARIAAALEVEAHTLFLTNDTTNNNEADDAGPKKPLLNNIRKYLFPGVAALLVFSLALIFFRFYVYEKPSSPWGNLKPRLNTYAFVLLGNEGELEQALLKSLNKKLSEFYNVSSPGITSITDNTNPEFVVEQFGADGVLTVRMLKSGRLAAIQYFFYANKLQQAVHVDFYSAAEIPQSLDYITHQFTNIFNGILKEGNPIATPSLNAQREYLEGMALIDAPYSDFAYTKAQLHFRNAIARNPDFAEAHAGLCTALTDASWNGDSAEMLQEAKKHCETALSLNSENLRVLLANGNLKLKSGDAEGAKAWFLQSFIAFPGNSAAEEGLATVALQQHVATGEAHFLDQGEAHSKFALQYEPSSWSARFIYGNLLFYRGSMQAAIEQWQLAANKRPHEVLFHNIGTASFCMDELDTAEQTYFNNQRINKESYLSEEALGKVNYYRGNFSVAADLQHRALDKLGDDANIHQMWASLADSYRQAGNEAAALPAYKKALEIIEKDLLLGIAEHANALHRQYYLLRIQDIDPQAVMDSSLQGFEIDSKIAEGQNLSASEQIRLAQLYAFNGKLHEANVVWEKAAHTCPVYLKNPELVQLLGERHMQHAGTP